MNTMDGDKVLSVIIARKGSKGVPGKNMRIVGGKPLLEYMLDAACEASKIIEMDIILSTDSKEMMELAISKGVEAPFIRPEHLCGDDVTSYPVVKHAVDFMEKVKKIEYQYIAYLQPTCPLCDPMTIVKAISTLAAEKEFDSAVAVTEVETHPFRMKRIIDKKRLINYIDQGFEDMRPRQTLPPVYRRAGSVYASKRDVIMQQGTLVGKETAAIVVPSQEAVDVDSEVDLMLVDLLLGKNG